MTDDQAFELVDRHCSQLSEYFDSVQILASRILPDGTTIVVPAGSGNWYSRQGMARAFINRAQADQIGRSVASQSDRDTEE